MSDLISKSALIRTIKCRIDVHKVEYAHDKRDSDFIRCCECSEIERLVNEAPTVEAQPVVHCKDCSHWGIGVAGETEHVKCCEYGKYMVGENGYCCYADMRGGKNET